MTIISLLATKEPISTRNFQQNFAEARKADHAYEVVTQGNSVGVFIPKKLWDELMEDLQAQESNAYKKSIRCARKEVQQGDFLKGEDFLKHF